MTPSIRVASADPPSNQAAQIGGNGDRLRSLTRRRQLHLTQLKYIPATLLTQEGALASTLQCTPMSIWKVCTHCIAQYKCTVTSAPEYSGVYKCTFSNKSVLYQCTWAHYQCAVPVYKCTSVPVHKCTSVQVYKCTLVYSALARRWGDFNRIGGVSSLFCRASSLFIRRLSIFILLEA